MNSSRAVWLIVFFYCQKIVLCEVLLREWNVHEGSVCFMGHKSRGICQKSCVGQQPREYQNDICNPGQEQPLYCCVDRAVVKLFPTIYDNCIERTLFDEFIQRVKHEFEIEEYNYANTSHFIKESLKNYVKKCYEQSLYFQDELERSGFLKACLDISELSKFDRPLELELIGVDLVSTVGLFYANTLKCTGILIHRFLYITSASCILKAKETGEIPTYIKTLHKIEYDTLWDIQIIHIHRNYSPGNSINDIAIVEVNTKFRNNYWTPNMLCFWTNDWIPSEHLALSLHSYKKPIDIYQPLKCEKDVKQNAVFCNVCDFKEAHDLEGHLLIGSIQYIEGFQLHVPPRLVGIGSFNLSCSDNKPARITPIGPHLGWIENIMRERAVDVCYDQISFKPFF